MDGYAGWDSKYRIKVRVICARAYQALFMHNMLMRPSRTELENFGEPDYTIINAGRFPANLYTAKMTSTTSVNLSFEFREMVILGTEYAGEMKKGIFTVLNYLLPKQDILSMHCAANVGEQGDTALFFGLSGTGKPPCLRIRSAASSAMTSTVGASAASSILKAVVTPSASAYPAHVNPRFTMPSALAPCSKRGF